MRYAFPIALSVALPFLASCTIPDQRQVTGVDLVDIVQNIRCETRDALQAHRVLVGGQDHAIGFGFDFNTEQNKNLGGSATLSWPLAHGVFSVGLDGGLDKKRYGDEKVTIAETFTELQDIKCERREPKKALSYPIVGKIGVDDVIEKYLVLTSIKTADVKDYSRTLRFTLKMRAGVSPQWDLVPIRAPKVKASIDADIDRQDFHEVKIVIAPVPRKKTAAELLEDKVVYVRILGDRRPADRAGDRGAGSGGPPPRITSPAAADLAKRRVIDQVRENRLNDTYKQIERELGPLR